MRTNFQQIQKLYKYKNKEQISIFCQIINPRLRINGLNADIVDFFYLEFKKRNISISKKTLNIYFQVIISNILLIKKKNKFTFSFTSILTTKYYMKDFGIKTTFRNFLKFLNEEGYISIVLKGFKFDWRSCPTRYCAEKKIIEIIEKNNLLIENVYEVYNQKKIIEIKKGEKMEIFSPFKNYPNQNIFKWKKFSRKMFGKLKNYQIKNEIIEYNNFLKTWEFFLDDKTKTFYEENSKINFYKTSLYRKFKNSISLHGRLYGGWWQLIPKKDRNKILFSKNGNIYDAVELDFKNSFITILYALHEIKPPENDLYNINLFKDKKMKRLERSLVKQAIIIILNTNSKRKSINAIMAKGNTLIRKFYNIEKLNTGQGMKRTTAKFIIDEIYRKNPILTNYEKIENVGMSLMLIESEIVIEILKQSMKNNIIVLPIYDSFVFPKIHFNQIQEIIRKSCLKNIGMFIETI